MRKLIVLFSCMLAGIVSAYTQNEKADTETYKETLFVPYHVKNMTILLGKSERDRNRPDVKRWYQYWAKEHAQASMKGKPCPDFVLVDSLGQSRRISDYIGKHKLLFLDFWASWCGPCRRLEPKMKEMLKKYEDRGFGILGISIDRDKNAWLKALREDKRNWQDLCIATAEDEKESGKLLSLHLRLHSSMFWKIITGKKRNFQWIYIKIDRYSHHSDKRV